VIEHVVRRLFELLTLVGYYVTLALQLRVFRSRPGPRTRRLTATRPQPLTAGPRGRMTCKTYFRRMRASCRDEAGHVRRLPVRTSGCGAIVPKKFFHTGQLR